MAKWGNDNVGNEKSSWQIWLWRKEHWRRSADDVCYKP